MKDILERLLDGEHLTEDEAGGLLTALAEDRLPGAVAGAFLAGLRLKRETAEEIRGFARAMRSLARRPQLPPAKPVDIVGTGGDGSGSLNLSTGSALLAAASGLDVVKHGNRSVSSRCGSADVLEALGLDLPLDEKDAGQCLRDTGFTFLFAPHYHPAMKALVPVRKALGVRTVFNILGPLTNPAEPPFMVVGAFSPEVAGLMAEALSGLPIERAFVVHGEPGWDEATPCGSFQLFDVRPGSVTPEVRDPLHVGIPRCAPEDLAGGDAAQNAAALRKALQGETGPHQDALALGAGLALEVTGAVASLELGVEAARAAIESGAAGALLDRLAAFKDGGSSATGAAGVSDLLSRMAASSRRRVRRAREAEDLGALRDRALSTPDPAPLELGRGFNLIAEIKRRAPSAGRLREATGDDVGSLAAGYARAGAAAVSVLTEPSEFGGSLADLSAAATAAPGIPVLRKDFVVDPYQVYEARAAGAGGILLILRMLDTATLESCLEAAARCGLFVLLEAFDEADLQRAGPAAEMCRRLGIHVLTGLNCRDLASLEVDFARFGELSDRFPPGTPRVAESGLTRPEQAGDLAALGYDAALVGTALMRSGDPEASAREVLAAGRAGVVARGSVWVKICGVNSPESALAVSEAGADAAGFVFAESPRRVTAVQALELASLLPPDVERVAVFWRPTSQEIADVLSEFPADIVQCEPSDDVREAVARAGARFLPVLHDDPGLRGQLAGVARSNTPPAALLEAAGKGGRGAEADWGRAAEIAGKLPLVLAGGLTPENVADAIQTVRPYGVDVSSGVEASRGRKDPVRIASFVEAARAAARASVEGDDHTLVEE
jgi:anthranilate phosphoribosyltransferase